LTLWFFKSLAKAKRQQDGNASKEPVRELFGGGGTLRIRLASETKSAFTLGVRDSTVESPNTMLAIYDLKLVAMKILC
jgi:hypothetical protein